MIRGIILAAGEGTRMKSYKSKVLHEIIDKKMIEYVVEKAKKACDDLVLVVNKNNKKDIENLFSGIHTVVQEVGEKIPYGTGYRASLALDSFDDEGVCLILSGDVPLLKSETLIKMLSIHEKNEYKATVLTCKVENPSGYGRILYDEEGNLIKIVEEKDASIEEKKIDEINSGIYAFDIKELKKAIGILDFNNAQGELYLTDVIKIFSNKGYKIGTYSLDYDKEEEIKGINNKKQLSEAEDIMRKRINDRLMLEGVIMKNPSSISISDGVEIGKDTIIESNVTILGNSKIGDNCVITSNSTIINSTLEDNVLIRASFIEDSYIEKDVDVGPYSHLRPNSRLKRHVHIGNFVEVKNASLGENTKAGHLAYIGDADVGKNVNIGCGVIFVNYDGKFKHRSTVEDNAFIGSNANIIAPVHLSEEAYIASGSTITKDVGKGELSIERSEQKNIKGYVEKKKKRDMLKEKENKSK